MDQGRFCLFFKNSSNLRFTIGSSIEISISVIFLTHLPQPFLPEIKVVGESVNLTSVQ